VIKNPTRESMVLKLLASSEGLNLREIATRIGSQERWAFVRTYYGIMPSDELCYLLCYLIECGSVEMRGCKTKNQRYRLKG